MLAIEIKAWYVLSVIVVSAPLLWVINYILKIFITFAQNIYTKIQHKKNLQTIKENILNNEKSETYVNTTTQVNQKDTAKEKISLKLEKIKYEAIAYKEKGDIENYEKKVIEGLSIDNENLDFVKMLGELYFNIGNYTKALPLLKKILENDTQDHKTIWQVGQIYFDKGDTQTAKLLVEKAIQLKPDNPKYYVTLAEIMYSKEDLQVAITLMERVVKLRPTNINYLLAIANLYEESLDTKNAKKYYFKILEIEPNHEIAKDKIKNL